MNDVNKQITTVTCTSFGAKSKEKHDPLSDSM